MASSDRSSKRSSRSPANPRPRRRAAAASAPSDSQEAPTEETAQEPQAGTNGGNAGSLEGALSLTLGVLLIVAALFPRSIRQLLMLGIGGGLVYLGRTGIAESTGRPK